LRRLEAEAGAWPPANVGDSSTESANATPGLLFAEEKIAAWAIS
jgi:hypothetical protein